MLLVEEKEDFDIFFFKVKSPLSSEKERQRDRERGASVSVSSPTTKTTTNKIFPPKNRLAHRSRTKKNDGRQTKCARSFRFSFCFLCLSLSLCVCVSVCLLCVFFVGLSLSSPGGEEGEILTHSLPRSKRLKEGNALSLSLSLLSFCRWSLR